MKVCTIVFGLLVACAVSYAQVQYEHQAPLLVALQPQQYGQQVEPQHGRQKRSLLLGALGAGALGAGLLGAGVIGAGALGAGALGAGLIGAKAGFVGGALASRAFHGRSYGSYGYGGGYGGGYYAEPVVYGGYRSYPAYYVEDEWC